MDEPLRHPPVSGFSVVLWILAALAVAVGSIAVAAGFSDHSDGVINIGCGLAITGIFFAAFGAVISKLVQIEWHLRYSARAEKTE